MSNFKDCRRLYSYISLYLNTRKLPKIAKLGHGRCFLQSIFALEKLRYEIINAQTSSLRLGFKCRPLKNGHLIFCQILGRFRQLLNLLLCTYSNMFFTDVYCHICWFWAGGHYIKYMNVIAIVIVIDSVVWYITSCEYVDIMIKINGHLCC